MKKLSNLLALILLVSGSLTGCIQGNEKPVVDTGGSTGSNVFINGNITTNTTWTTGKVYVLSGRITVTAGATLTIQPGVIVKGEVGTGANASALVIARGAKINAVGTATQPIIFTSVADEIKPGQIASPNMDPTLEGLW